MDMITISAKSLDEAITKALIELQTTSEHLHYEVVQKESAGVFGIFGAKPCVIRARVMGEDEEKALKKAAADKEKAEKAALAEKERAAKEAAKAAERAAAAAKKEAEQKAEAAAVVEEKKELKEQPEKKYSEKKNPERKKQERRDGGRKERPERQNRRNDAHAPETAEAEKPVKEEKPKQPVKADPEKVQTAAKTFLIDVFGAMGMEVSVETVLDLEEGELQVMMAGDDMGILIGKRGQTLDSLQYLVSLVVNKETEGYLRVKLDTENYRERRKETLETLARNISYKVKRTKRPVSLEPMNPYERRIIHSALQNDRYVVTRSEGEDPYRHVVISLKNDRYSGGRDKRYGSRRDRGERRYEKHQEKPVAAVTEVTAAKAEGSEE
jgi:spoIIIJ-associated protein